MCNCIEEIEEKVKKHLTEIGKYKKPITKVEACGKGFSVDDHFQNVIWHDFEITLEGQKKKPTIPVKHSYCPFCGEKKEQAKVEQQ